VETLPVVELPQSLDLLPTLLHLGCFRNTSVTRNPTKTKNGRNLKVKKKFVATVVITVVEEEGRTVTKAQVSKALREGKCYIEDKNFQPVAAVEKIAIRNIDID